MDIQKMNYHKITLDTTENLKYTHQKFNNYNPVYLQAWYPCRRQHRKFLEYLKEKWREYEVYSV